MASWVELVEYVRANYKIKDEAPENLSMLFGTRDGRSQLVFVHFHTLGPDDESWIQIESPIGSIDELPLRPLLSESENMVCGGFAVVGDVVVFRHALPLANLDSNEFDAPLALVTGTADSLERKYLGSDRF